MLQKLTTHKRLIVYTAGLVGLCILVWLIVTVKNVSDHTISEPKVQTDNSVSTTTLRDDSPSIQDGLDKAESDLDQAEVVASGTDGSESEQCSTRCNRTLSMLDEDVELDDETYQNLASYTAEIASYLQGDEQQRQHYIQMAMTTTDGDKRAFLTDILNHLSDQLKDEIADKFIGSDNWRVRVDGLTLMVDHGIESLDEANSLMSIFASEENPYIKSSILSYLEQSPSFRGDVEILQQLDSAIYYDTNTSVQVAALKAKLQLSEEPYHILPDALQALRASEPEFQLAGLVAIEKVLEHEKKVTGNGVYIDMRSIENEFEIIRSLAVYGDDKKRFDRLIQEANTIYLRYFEY